MSQSLKLGIMLIVLVLALGLVIRFLQFAYTLALPLGIVAGIGLIIYGLVSRKALGGSGRRYLP